MTIQLNQKIVDGVLHLSWNKYGNAHHYRIMAMSQTFVYYLIKTISEVKYDFLIKKNCPYIRFKVIAESNNDDFLAESNEVNILYSNIERFGITALDGYNGTTLTFRSKGVYDLYKIYIKDSLIAETEDPILELLHRITKNKLGDILVEGYVKNGSSYLLGGVSDRFVEIPERKESNYKISVVIPVYNAETFLSRTVDSILSSSMSDIEIVLVDDGSTDNSLKICKWYAKHFPCVSIVQQKNQRVAIARNTGVAAAKGEFIGFADNDDIVHPFMYENLYKSCKIKNTDISIATTIIRKDVNDKEFCLNMPNKKENVIVYTYDDVMHNIHNSNNMFFVAVWNKIVKAKIAKQINFPTEYPNSIVLYEDSAYTPTLYSYIDKFTLCKDAFYIRDKRKQKTVGTASTMHKRESADDIWKAFIYAYSYPIYNRCEKHAELSDYTNFKRIIESYDKFNESSSLYNYWNEKLGELINRQKLHENKLIMGDNHLKEIVNKFRN